MEDRGAEVRNDAREVRRKQTHATAMKHPRRIAPKEDLTSMIAGMLFRGEGAID